MCICNLYSSYVLHVLPLKYTVEVFNGLAMFKAIVQSVQRLIVDNTHALESVLTFSGQLQTVTTTNPSSKTLPRCQQMRLPSLVPTGVLCSTRRHVSSSNLQCLQACTIANTTMFTCVYHRHLYNVYSHRIINTIIQSPDFSRVNF